ncbi:MAG: triose-phosphate isomerase, partial [Betaproteobacteria bacterium]|nr:triose-phosphate isomerase [Betaproteobacteria bacterium]
NDKTTVGRQHAKDIPLYLGAQNLAAQSDGAWTGEVSGPMLLDCGCAAVILGHSERRQHFYETDAMIATKLCLAIASGLVVLLCVGESEQARHEGRTEAVIAKQLEVLTELPPGQREAAFQPVIAYEPLWAIGSGRSANPEDAQKVHASIRKQMLDAGFAAAHLRILYGGSVKPENAAALFAMPDIDGALVGGAALEAKQFLAIGEAAIRRIIAPVPEERKSWPG